MAPPTKYAVALFPGFQALDAFGSLDALNYLSERQPLELSVLHTSLEPVSTLLEPTPGRIGQSILPTHTYDTAPEDIEVLLIPGGRGAEDGKLDKLQGFIKERYPNLRFLLTVCTGSIIAARAGVLDGKQATSNKQYFAHVESRNPGVKWVKKARWVVDGNVWTASGVTAGIDMIFAFISDQYGKDVADYTSSGLEYVRNYDSTDDPFASLDYSQL